MTRGKVCIVMLAAGRSERFGSAKLLAEYRGKPLLHHALSAAQGTCSGDIHLVVGHNAEAISDAAAGFVATVIRNEAYATGTGSSIACGVRACREHADAILIMLADQPLVSSAHLAQLVDRWTGAPDEIIASRFSGTNGPPVLFASTFFDELEQLRGDMGARVILRNNPNRLRTVDFEAASIDIDTPEDLGALASGNDA